MKKFRVVSILLVILAIMLSCLLGFAQETKGKVITFSRPEEIQKLDPYDAYKISNQITDYFLYDRLVERDPETGVGYLPGLATEWNVSPDAKEYTFTLRQGVKFHNGEPFNAESVKVSLERFLKEEIYDATLWETLKEVEIVDDYNVIIRFNKPFVLCLLNLLRTPMLPPKAFTEKGTDLFFENPIGTGAFTFESFTPGQDCVFKKNPEYWGKPAYMDKFVYKYLAEDSTRVAGVYTGEIDIADSIPCDRISSLEKEPNMEVFKVPAWDYTVLGLKCDKPPFDDIRFRQAVSLAIDRESIVKYVTKSGKPATGIIPTGAFGYDDSLPPLKRDIEKAKQLVKETNYDGREIVIISPPNWTPKTKEILQVVQANFIEAGINAKINIMDGAAYSEKRAAGEYDMHFTSADYPGDINLVLNLRILHGETVAFGYVNKELNELILKQAMQIDTGKRIELLRKIENILNAEYAPYLYLDETEQIFLKRKGITGGRWYYDKAPDLRYVHYEE